MFDLSGTGLSNCIHLFDPLQHLLSDLTTILKKVDPKYPNFIMGHCLGGLMVMTLMTLNPNLDIKGVILTSPLIQPDALKN